MTVGYPSLGRAGRLGNQLWQIAGTAGIAARRGDEPQFPPDWPYRPYFRVPSGYFDNLPAVDAAGLAEHLDPRTRAYLQDFSLWRHIAPNIRAWFQPTTRAQDLLADLERHLPDALRHHPRIALHVRRGDNIVDPDVPDKQLYYPQPTLDYYRAAIAQLPDWPIIVFSDDPAWCDGELRRQLAVPFHVWYGEVSPKENDPRYGLVTMDWIDLQLMARSTAVITANSSYSWWGAWLSADPHPIYPSVFYGPKLLEYCDPALMFTDPRWRKVDVTQ